MTKSRIINRRNLVKGAFAAAIAAVGSGLIPFRNQPIAWHMPDLSALKPGDELNLRSSLPFRSILFGNGVFAVDPSGAPLPEGINLTKDGLLKVDHKINSICVSGIIFSYDFNPA